MSESPRRALLALGVSRLLNLEQKKRQKDRARKVSAYLKIAKAIHSDIFKCQLRIDSSSLFKLLGLVRPFIESLKVDLEEVSAEERLLVTLKYLATGCSMEQLSYGPVKPRLLMSIIPQTCNAINKCLREYVKLPKTEKAWEDMAQEFEKKWQFSHCVGALVAKHISVQKPLDEPEKFVNHKNFHSIVVVGLVNANHEFTYINTGSNGGYEHVYVNTSFFEMITEERLELPKDCPLNGTNESMPYIFVGETDFLIENIMRPYPKDQLTPEKKVFNYRLFRAKQVADNAFGMLYERFGIFHKDIGIKEEDLNSVVMACCMLHNYLIRNSKDYLNEESLDVEDVNSFRFKAASWRLKQEGGMQWGDTHPLLSLNQGPETTPDSRGEIVRDMFTKYFNNEGKVPFQDQMVNVVPEI